jgi:hypothetical protein
MEGLNAWLKKYNLVDNDSNRFRYIASLDASTLQVIKHPHGDIIEL